MIRKFMVILTIVCFLPSLASASWSLNTWAKSGGGTISVRGGAPQASDSGSVFKTYTTSQSFAVTVSSNTGYNISQVNHNNIVTSYPSQTSYTVQGPGSQNVYATFAPQPITVTASAGAGGSVNLARITGIYYGTTLTTARKFTFTPSSTFNVSSITGIPAGATVNPALPAAANTPVVVTLPVGFTFTSNIGLAGSFFGPPIAKTAPPQVVNIGALTKLDGSSSTGIISSYIWNQISGPGYPTNKVILDNTPGVETSFTPGVAGTYTFSLTVAPGGSTALTTVTVTDNISGVIRTQCQSCHAGNGIGPNVFANWSSSPHRSKYVICSQCHIGANTGGHPGQLTGGSVDEATFNYKVPFGTGNFCITCHNPAIVTDFTSSGHASRAGAASCSFCHTGGVHNPAAACINCHKPGNQYGLSWPPLGMDFHNAYTGTNLCSSCHNQHSGAASGGSCNGCHDCPPATASHMKHYGSTAIVSGYGDLRITQAFTNYSSGYVFGCGNCHPMDLSKHRNNVVDVELYNPQAAIGTLKAKNSSLASYVSGDTIFTDAKGISYTKGTCSNVYCHSYNEWTTPAAIGDGESNWEAKVVVTRKYKTVTWGSTPLGCSGCHGNPTQTSSPSNDGGAGDSHSWIDAEGYQNLHTFNMGFLPPVSCTTCHNDTVKQFNTYTVDGLGVRTLNGVPISNFAKHVNGTNDVAFDTKNPIIYSPTYSGSVSLSLTNATYDPTAKNCSNVSCHREQTVVKWGTPYRWYYNECNVCHSY